MKRTTIDRSRSILEDSRRRLAGEQTLDGERKDRTRRVAEVKADFRVFVNTYMPQEVKVPYPQWLIDLVHYRLFGMKKLEGTATESEAATWLAAAKRLNRCPHLQSSFDLAEKARKKFVIKIHRGFGKSLIFGRAERMFAMAHGQHLDLLASYDEKKALGLQAPLMAELKSNQLYREDFGLYYAPAGDSMANFITTRDDAFFGIGCRQDPRGFNHRNYRPNSLRLDDFDNHSICRNPDLTKQYYDWVGTDLMACGNPSGHTLFTAVGTIIHPESVLARLSRDPEAVVIECNLLDERGSATWPERFTPEIVEDIRKQHTPREFAQEYMNKPQLDGEIWKDADFRWKEPLPIGEYDALLMYGDAAFAGLEGDPMAWSLWGMTRQPGRKPEFHKLKCFLRRVPSNRDWARWMLHFVHGKELRGELIGQGELWGIPPDALYKLRILYECGTNVMTALPQMMQDVQAKAGLTVTAAPHKEYKKNKQERITMSHDYWAMGQVYYSTRELNNADMLWSIEMHKDFRATAKYKNQLDDGPDADEGALSLLARGASGYMVASDTSQAATPAPMPSGVFGYENTSSVFGI